MRRLLRRIEFSQAVSCGVALAVLSGLLVTQCLIVPAYRRWRDLRDMLDLQAAELNRLTQNLSVQGQVEHLLQQLPEQAWQTSSDEITFSDLFQELDKQIRRRRDVGLVNAKPTSSEAHGKAIHNEYRVQLSVDGPLPEVYQFITELTNGAMVIGVENLSLHAIRGYNKVECSASIWMVRLPQRPGDSQGLGRTTVARELTHGN